MKRWAVAAVAALVAVAGQARAETSVAVTLSWQTFTPADKTMRGFVAQAPKVEVKRVTQSDGARILTMKYSDGTYCSANEMVAGEGGPIALTCGTENRYYLLIDVAGVTSLTWHSARSGVAVGDKG